MNSKQWAADIRALADVLENAPDDKLNGITFNVYAFTASELVDITKILGGDWEKKADDDYWFSLRQPVGVHSIEVFANRTAVCERVVTGVETVEVPDPEAPTITMEREIVDWVCPPSLLAIVKADA